MCIKALKEGTLNKHRKNRGANLPVGIALDWPRSLRLLRSDRIFREEKGQNIAPQVKIAIYFKYR
jgi:hypothetical protein